MVSACWAITALSLTIGEYSSITLGHVWVFMVFQVYVVDTLIIPFMSYTYHQQWALMHAYVAISGLFHVSINGC